MSQKEWNVFREMINEWPFFQTQLAMLEMVLAKADAEISSYYDQALVEPALQPMGEDFRQRMSGLVTRLNKVKGQHELLEDTPEIHRSLELRNTYTDPLHFLQIELMARCRSVDHSNEEVNKALLVTIAGIAASMRNTG